MYATSFFYRFLLALSASIFMLTAAQAQQTLPSAYSDHVNDFADVLPPETEAELTQMLQVLREEQGREMTVVTVKRQSAYGEFRDIADFGTQLFNAWGVGAATRNDGIMLLFATDDRQMRIVLGDGYPARYDGVAKRIIDAEITPRLQTGQVEQGILHGTAVAIERLDPSRPPESEIPDSWWQVVQQKVADFIVPIIFSIAVAVIAAPKWVPAVERLLLRYKPRRCPECGDPMVRLGEAQQLQYLSEGQLREEELDAKQYNVWFCPRDEHVTIKSRAKLGSRYKACPECGYHTREVHRHDRVPATRTQEGKAELNHSCANCGFRKFETIAIPILRFGEDRTPSGHSGSGAGSGSSGFGGGRSSGGGASGRW